MRVADALIRRSGGTVLILRRRAGEMVRLEGPAAAVWDELVEPASIDDLVEQAGAAVPSGAADVVGAAVDALEAKGLVARERSPER